MALLYDFTFQWWGKRQWPLASGEKKSLLFNRDKKAHFNCIKTEARRVSLLFKKERQKWAEMDLGISCDQEICKRHGPNNTAKSSNQSTDTI